MPENGTASGTASGTDNRFNINEINIDSGTASGTVSGTVISPLRAIPMADAGR